jgi:porin
MLLGAASAAAGAGAGEYPSSDYLFGNWLGARDTLYGQGLDIRFHYTTEPMANVSGGEIEGGTYTDNIGLDLLFDLQKLLGLPGASLLVKLSQRDGDSVSSEFVAPSLGGNTFTIQEIYGGQTWKVANVQLNLRLLDDRAEIALGRIVANDDFLRSPLYCQFVNNSYCGSPKPVFLQNPFTFSAYPAAQWGLRGRLDLADRRLTLQAAVYDGDPELKGGDPASKGHNPHGINWGLGNNGVVLAGEVQYHLNRDSTEALPGTYKLGGYWMDGDFQDLSQTDNATVQGNAMIWALADQMLYRERPGADEGLSGFATWVYSLEDKVNQMDNYFSVGLVYKGLIPSRPRDSTGLAFSKGWFSGEWNKALAASGQPTKDEEAVIELNYALDLGHGIALQPDLQYIIRPGGTGTVDNAFAIGARLSIQF